jgi:hypothetical protein
MDKEKEISPTDLELFLKATRESQGLPVDATPKKREK